jgi:phosphatidylserine/phosphatidylglycerophosphate/cardiolipin synthase-like enzyme
MTARGVLSPRHIDGHDYMWAVSEMIDHAKEAIFIQVGVFLLQ